MTAKLFLAKIIFYTHLAMTFVILFGWALPPSFLIYHLILVPAIIIHWWFNNNQCVLTQWQHRLEGGGVDPNEQGQFVKSLFKHLGREPSEKFLFCVIYGLMGISFSLSLLRFTLSA